MQEQEMKQLREQVEQLQQKVQELEDKNNENVPAPDNAPPPHAPNQPGVARRAMNFMYNAGNLHAAARNFLWALDDGAKIAGFIGGCAVAAAKAAPAVAAKVGSGSSAVGKAAKENPKATAIGIGVVAAITIAERVTRYEDEDGNTKHRCAIM